MKVIVEKGGYLPTRGNSEAVGYDLTSPTEVVIPPKSSAEIDTKIRVSFYTPGVYGEITHRSGVNFKDSLVVPKGTIDPDYRGCIKVKVYNLSDHNQTIRHGQKFAQLILIPFLIEPVEQVEELDETERGDKGFGSTDEITEGGNSGAGSVSGEADGVGGGGGELQDGEPGGDSGGDGQELPPAGPPSESDKLIAEFDADGPGASTDGATEDTGTPEGKAAPRPRVSARSKKKAS